jgi:hypothetical protein
MAFAEGIALVAALTPADGIVVRDHATGVIASARTSRARINAPSVDARSRQFALGVGRALGLTIGRRTSHVGKA